MLNALRPPKDGNARQAARRLLHGIVCVEWRTELLVALSMKKPTVARYEAVKCDRAASSCREKPFAGRAVACSGGCPFFDDI
ncbi:hypothetical protein [Agrobacterium cavarae]|uniref:hypothetical protein n=1 Tax=Agrobacterium cavarae TaxID=2528239 RepID=UPI003FD56850